MIVTTLATSYSSRRDTEATTVAKAIEADWDAVRRDHQIGNAAGYRLESVIARPTDGFADLGYSSSPTVYVGDISRSHRVWTVEITHRGQDLAHGAADAAEKVLRFEVYVPSSYAPREEAVALTANA